MKLITRTKGAYIVVLCILLIYFGIIRWLCDKSWTLNRTVFSQLPSLSTNHTASSTVFYRRQICSCKRPILEHESNPLIIDQTSSSLCDQYSAFRGRHQRVIAISMYGPKDNPTFTFNASVNFLHELIADIAKIYPGWILRIYHDGSVREDIICLVECSYNNVDFCNTTALGKIGNVKDYIPPKIWRFIPAGDLFVDIMLSRDLDSPLSEREFNAVNDWLSTKKPWHVMRDHPLHDVPMPGGLWGFRPALNRKVANMFLNKLLNRSLISKYGRRGDQTFLSRHIWHHIQGSVIAHDSYLCTRWYGKNSRPWPSRRPLLNETNCFVGCKRPCCPPVRHPFGECPIACRPPNHKDWTMC